MISCSKKSLSCAFRPNRLPQKMERNFFPEAYGLGKAKISPREVPM